MVSVPLADGLSVLRLVETLGTSYLLSKCDPVRMGQQKVLSRGWNAVHNFHASVMIKHATIETRVEQFNFFYLFYKMCVLL